MQEFRPMAVLHADLVGRCRKDVTAETKRGLNIFCQ